MRQAAARGTQAANRRGMLNSSLAVGSAYGAAMDRALPIAQQDANSFREQQFLNQGYSNEEAKWLSDAQYESEKLNTGLEQDTNTFNATNTLENDRINANVTNEANAEVAAEWNQNNFAVLTADLQTQLASIDAQFAERLSAMENEYGLLENLDSVNGSIYQQMIAEIGSILANEDKISVAQSKVNNLIEAAGVEFEFSNGTTPSGDGAATTTGDTTGTAGVRTDPATLPATGNFNPVAVAPAPEPEWTPNNTELGGGGAK